MSGTSDWAATGGATWALRCQDTDRALQGVEDGLIAAISAACPAGLFRAFEIGCGAGATTLDLVRARTDAEIVACDISGALVEVAKLRLAEHKQVRFVVSDAQAAAAAEGPFDLFYSRHGVMFFPDPTTAFAQFRGASTGGARLVFSCFRSWEENPWASELACAAANGRVPAPGREPSGFAFAEPGYVGDILSGAGWSEVRNAALDFTYVAGSGPAAVEQALSFLTEIGPAAAVVRELDEPRRPVARDRMRKVLADHVVEDRVEFPAAAWIWTATAA